MPYEDTLNKKTIRLSYDLPILKQWQTANDRKLTYFGLTGPEIHDLRDWQDVLGRQRTAVESPGVKSKDKERFKETKRRMNSNVMNLPNNGSSGFQLLEDDIEDVIIHGLDRNGNHPSMSDGGKAEVARFSYNLVNLDFEGGLGYTNNRGDAKRINAIKKLFERQKGTNFVLLVTISMRHTLKDEFDIYLDGMRSRSTDAESQNIITWYLQRGDGELKHKIKATFPSFVQNIAEPNSFKCYCYPPVFYVGHQRTSMLHFAFNLQSTSAYLKAWSEQDNHTLLNLPLLDCNEGKFSIVSTGLPGFNMEQHRQALGFLSDQTRASIIESAEPKDTETK